MVNLDYINQNKHQLWAEAYEAYKQKESYHLTNGSSLEILRDLHEDREFDGPALDKIRDYLNRYPIDFIDMDELVEKALNIKHDQKSMKEMASVWAIVGIAMHKLRWKKGNNKNRRRYYPPKNFYKHESQEELEQWTE